MGKCFRSLLFLVRQDFRFKKGHRIHFCFQPCSWGNIVGFCVDTVMSVMNPGSVCADQTTTCFSWSTALWCFPGEASSFTQISVQFSASFHSGLKTLCYAFAFLGSITLWSHFDPSHLYIHNLLSLCSFQALSQGLLSIQAICKAWALCSYLLCKLSQAGFP